ncbi:hypothetical protein BO78DRAFT_416503 [Aspergillus sclerotiicarbonarius CBS 121057]|uniref:Uncharacterized protein n=1 Tax=Aspergillus sclerotiicarbonarius (strain CBS 121057 / IBT 28362) TaxID=1448318 RepID=A0A319EGH3_ASPSB|nr:hypothetical protein BO78DRAFT_416503 [Aspergillus sclerotiicarbonarius CBS 121057]
MSVSLKGLNVSYLSPEYRSPTSALRDFLGNGGKSLAVLVIHLISVAVASGSRLRTRQVA